MPMIASAANSDTSNSVATAIGRMLPALLPLISLLVGIIVSIDQIFRTTKVRHTIEWIDKAVDGNASCEFRQQVLNELRLSQESALVASLYVPWRKFMWLPLWAIGTGYIVICFEIDDKLSKDSELLWVFYFLGCLYFSWRSIGLYAEKEWVRHLYKEGYFPKAKKKMRGTHAGRAVVTLVYSVYLLSLCVDIVLAADVKGAYSYLVVLFTLVGFSLFLIAIIWERRWSERWPEYFAGEYIDRWRIGVKHLAAHESTKDDVPSRSI